MSTQVAKTIGKATECDRCATKVGLGQTSLRVTHELFGLKTKASTSSLEQSALGQLVWQKGLSMLNQRASQKPMAFFKKQGTGAWIERLPMATR